MERPAPGTYFPDRDQYWDLAEQHRADNGSLPDFAFDFISVHDPRIFPSRGFSLISPMVLVEKADGRRPAFEKVSAWPTREAAARSACRLARRLKLFVVDCCGY